MANDYNIYVRYRNEGSASSNQVIPHKETAIPKPTEPTLPKEIKETSAQGVSMPNIDFANLSFKGLTTKLVHIWAFTKAVQITDQVATTYFDLQSGYTGNYVNARNYNNFKALMTTSPMQLITNVLNAEMQTKVDYEKKSQEQLLIGNYTKGV